MKENSVILRLRVLLAFLNDDEPCTVMSIARTLKEEHYTISRVISSLEKEGLINRKAPRRPELTEAGKRVALFYQERIYTTMNHLFTKESIWKVRRTILIFGRCIILKIL